MRIILFLILSLQISVTAAFTWPQSTPEQEGMDSAGISQAIELISSGDFGDIRSLIIIKNGKLITEKYFSDNGQMAPVYSVTKSVGSALLGIAKYQGAELNLDTSMMDYMPQFANISDFANKDIIKLKDLLAQRHGLNWDEWTIPYEHPNNPVTLMLGTSDWYRTVLEWPVAHEPNQDYAYSTGASSLMSIILNNVTNQSPYLFARAHLFLPLDILTQNTHWELVGKAEVMGQGISVFPYGLEPLGFGLWLRPLDMAKIGELYRNGGMWEGVRLLSESWIEKSIFSYSNGVTDPDIFAASNTGYGYQWWTTVFTDKNNKTYDSYYASGYGRQFIFVIPEIDMILVSTAKDFDYTGQGIGFLLRNHILPAQNLGTQGHFLFDRNMNGSWYWPENSGQGINIEVLEDRNEVLAYWYTYENSESMDTGRQRWFIMQGEIIDEKSKLTIRSTTGGSFVISDPPGLIEWGTGELFFSDCNSGYFQFSSIDENVSATIPLTRLTGGNGCQHEMKNKSQKPPFYVK